MKRLRLFQRPKPQEGDRRGRTRFAWTPRNLIDHDRKVWLVSYHEVSEYKNGKWVVDGEMLYLF